MMRLADLFKILKSSALKTVTPPFKKRIFVEYALRPEISGPHSKEIFWRGTDTDTNRGTDKLKYI